MKTEYAEYALEQINETISRLESPVSSIDDLLPLLTAPLDALGLLPPAFLRYNTQPFSKDSKHGFSTARHLPRLQNALIQGVAPTWQTNLREKHQEDLLYQYFCPDSFFAATQPAGYVALSAYSIFLSNPLSSFSTDALQKLSRLYTIDRMHSVIFGKESNIPRFKQLGVWEDLLKNVFAIPAKVANFYQSDEPPQGLRYYEFCTLQILQTEPLLASLTKRAEPDELASLSSLVAKMVIMGLFPTAISLSLGQPSFFATTLSKIRSRLATAHDERRQRYAEAWRGMFSSLPLGLFSKILASLFSHCSELPAHEDPSAQSRGLVKRESRLMLDLLGPLEDSSDEKWASISAALLTKSWSLSKARMLVCWAALSDENAIRPHAMETLIQQALEVWSSREHIEHSLLSAHQYITSILILSICHFSESSPAIQSVALSHSFIDATGDYIKHMDPAVRRCGMLAAEIIAQRSGRSLDFQQWEGDGQGREWARALRALAIQRDVDTTELEPDATLLMEEIDGPNSGQTPGANLHTSALFKKTAKLSIADDGSDSDDSLMGYASSSASSRPPSPTASEMEEIEKDPTLNVGKKLIKRPVYLADLGRLITESTKPDDPQNADRIEMALSCAAELIRKKKTFGYELEENAVNLTHALIFLNNNFDLEEFNERRQAALSALVACCPKKSASTIIQEFFKNQYSTEQRFNMLSALTLGARELANLPIPAPVVHQSRTLFPSKQLPYSTHRKYLAEVDLRSASHVRGLLDDISSAAIESGKDAAESKTAPVVRSRRLRIGKSSTITETPIKSVYIPKESSFSEVAAEFFIGPLVGRFWQFLHDEQAREARSAHREMKYRGTGTGLILGPLVLSHFAECLAVLMHAARHAPEFLAVLVPETLEMALMLGTRPMSSSEEDRELEAAVLTASLELAVIVLDGCLELDGGRSLCLEKTNLLMGVGEWASQVMNLIESGVRVPGGGGLQELKLKRAAAGVVLKVDELSTRWRQSMFPL